VGVSQCLARKRRKRAVDAPCRDADIAKRRTIRLPRHATDDRDRALRGEHQVAAAGQHVGAHEPEGLLARQQGDFRRQAKVVVAGGGRRAIEDAAVLERGRRRIERRAVGGHVGRRRGAGVDAKPQRRAGRAPHTQRAAFRQRDRGCAGPARGAGKAHRFGLGARRGGCVGCGGAGQHFGPRAEAPRFGDQHGVRVAADIAVLRAPRCGDCIRCALPRHRRDAFQRDRLLRPLQVNIVGGRRTGKGQQAQGDRKGRVHFIVLDRWSVREAWRKPRRTGRAGASRLSCQPVNQSE